MGGVLRIINKTTIALNLQGACPHATTNLEGKANARRFDCPTLLVKVLAWQLIPF